MRFSGFSEYNKDQLISYRAIREACGNIPRSTVERLLEEIRPYLLFRRDLEEFQVQYLEPRCQKSCFETGVSACCGFESIITFFADQAINFLLSSPESMEIIFQVLEKPNNTEKCVYLGEKGCLWALRPISCAMFFCDELKKDVFAEHPDAESVFREFRRQEKEYTWPIKPVLFDGLEEYFLRAGAASPHMYFHQSPGLLRLKARSGL